MKKLLIIGAGILQVAVIKKAKEMGIFTLVADGNPNAMGLPLADKPIVANIVDPKALLSIALREKIDGVIHPCSEVAMAAVGTINDIMHLSGVGLEAAIRATNKEKMRKAFETGNAPSPFSKSAKTLNEAFEIINEINSDYIFKPSRNSGSRGVTRLNKNAIDVDIRVAFQRAFDNSFDESVVIEKYIEGPEFSVEMAIWDNDPQVIAVTDKLTSGTPYFVELGHNQPSRHSDETLLKIKNAAIAGCRALELNWCVAHVEIKLQDDEPFIIEIGARLGGDFISTELVHLSTGIDFTAAAIDLALGIIPDLSPKHPQQGAAIRYFTPPAGLLKSINFPDELLFDTNIYAFEVYKNVGDIIPDLRSSLDRSGHVIATGENAYDAITNAENALNQIEFEIGQF